MVTVQLIRNGAGRFLCKHKSPHSSLPAELLLKIINLKEAYNHGRDINP